jgi:tRNA pseudouridine55 synthase
MATGVLLVCAGKATRVAEYLMAGEKVYRAIVRLGSATDTYDRTGQVTAVAPVPELAAEDIERALPAFVGALEQHPPAYSAVKQGGVPLYRKARRGEDVETQPRSVIVHRIELLAWQTPDFTIEVTSSPGTYIRSLAHDLGQALGCGAHLAELVRLRSGRFSLAEAVPLDVVAASAAQGELARHLHPLSAALSGLICVVVDEDQAVRLAHGLGIPYTEPPDGGPAYAETPDGQLVAILSYDVQSGQWRPRKVFRSDN